MSAYTPERIAKERALIKSNATADAIAYEVRHPEKYPHCSLSYSAWAAALDEIERLQAENANHYRRVAEVLGHAVGQAVGLALRDRALQQEAP